VTGGIDGAPPPASATFRPWGSVTKWLGDRMTRTGDCDHEAIVPRIWPRTSSCAGSGDPFGSQCFGSVMGMDWHSAGITNERCSAR